MDEPEKPKREGKPNPQYAPCPICGSTDFWWGLPTSSGGVYFQRDRDLSGTGLFARECQTCGNVQMFTKRDR